MPFVFSYGTLQQAGTQLATIGRLLTRHHDVLPGFEVSSVKIDDVAIRAATGRTHHDRDAAGAAMNPVARRTEAQWTA